MAYTPNQISVFYFKFSVEKIAWPILVKLILLAKVLLISPKGCIIGLEYGGRFRRISDDTPVRKRQKNMEQLHCTTFNSINFRHFKWMGFLEHKYLLNRASDFKADFFFLKFFKFIFILHTASFHSITLHMHPISKYLWCESMFSQYTKCTQLQCSRLESHWSPYREAPSLMHI